MDPCPLCAGKKRALCSCCSRIPSAVVFGTPFYKKLAPGYQALKCERSNCHLHVGQCLVSIFLVRKTVPYNTFFTGFNQIIKKKAMEEIWRAYRVKLGISALIFF